MTHVLAITAAAAFVLWLDLRRETSEDPMLTSGSQYWMKKNRQMNVKAGLLVILCVSFILELAFYAGLVVGMQR